MENNKYIWMRLFEKNIHNNIKITINCIDIIYFYKNKKITYSYLSEEGLCNKILDLDEAINIIETACKEDKHIKIYTHILYSDYCRYGKNTYESLKELEDAYKMYNFKIKASIYYD